jgi:hypothetical protein
MTVENINVDVAIKRVNDLIAQESNISPALKASLEVLLLLVTILANRLGLNSKNSSKPPSSDPNRKKESDDAGGCLETKDSEQYRKRYRELLLEADQECPPPDETGKKKKGKTARSKARNLLERLRDFENETLRFMVDKSVPFSNNQAENDLRMTKVQQKISGCFRSMDGAKTFCRIRSYLSTCRKQGVTASDALPLLFQGVMSLPFNPDEEPGCNACMASMPEQYRTLYTCKVA